jgi:hypothetical protein
MGIPLQRQRDARLAVILCVFVGFLPTAQQHILARFRWPRAWSRCWVPMLR